MPRRRSPIRTPTQGSTRKRPAVPAEPFFILGSAVHLSVVVPPRPSARHHAALIVGPTAEECEVEDLGSTNRTALFDAAGAPEILEPRRPRCLGRAAELIFGDVRAMFRFVAGEPPLPHSRTVPAPAAQPRDPGPRDAQPPQPAPAPMPGAAPLEESYWLGGPEPTASFAPPRAGPGEAEPYYSRDYVAGAGGGGTAAGAAAAADREYYGDAGGSYIYRGGGGGVRTLYALEEAGPAGTGEAGDRHGVHYGGGYGGVGYGGGGNGGGGSGFRDDRVRGDHYDGTSAAIGGGDGFSYPAGARIESVGGVSGGGYDPYARGREGYRYGVAGVDDGYGAAGRYGAPPATYAGAAPVYGGGADGRRPEWRLAGPGEQAPAIPGAAYYEAAAAAADGPHVRDASAGTYAPAAVGRPREGFSSSFIPEMHGGGGSGGGGQIWAAEIWSADSGAGGRAGAGPSAGGRAHPTAEVALAAALAAAAAGPPTDAGGSRLRPPCPPLHASQRPSPFLSPLIWWARG